ncbi:MAG: archease [Candidatus Pacearchaeota archaeon]|jgi:SHS2 domain-containing protein
MNSQVKEGKGKFEFLPHTADIKFRAYGKNLSKLFENSALAMFNSMYSGKVKSKMRKSFSIVGRENNLEALLYSFLEKFLILLDTKNFFVAKLKVKIIFVDGKTRLNAEVFGDSVKNYQIDLDVKAVTYNEMFIKRISKSNNSWVCQVVLDV